MRTSLCFAFIAISLTQCLPSSVPVCDPASNRFPARVVSYVPIGAYNTNTDPMSIEGPPDCNLGDGHDLALATGEVEIDLGCRLVTHAGNDIRIWESDGTQCSGLSESFELSVSTDRQQYTQVGAGDGVTDFDVREPAVFRYIKIRAINGSASTSTPGPDIDAIEVL